MKFWDVFISHASEDKEEIATPLYNKLKEFGLRVWYDETEIGYSDNIIESIAYGLENTNYFIVILTKNFIKEDKKWTDKENTIIQYLNTLNNKVKIIPIYNDIKAEDLNHKFLFIKGISYIDTSKESFEKYTFKIAKRIFEDNILSILIDKIPIEELKEIIEQNVNKTDSGANNILDTIKENRDKQFIIKEIFKLDKKYIVPILKTIIEQKNITHTNFINYLKLLDSNFIYHNKNSLPTSKNLSKNKQTIIEKFIPLSERKKKKQKKVNQQEFKNIVFSCENISFKYKKSEDFILKNISFDLKYDEITALVGKNGSGKTTLLKIVANKLFPSSGGIMYPEFFYETNSYCRLTIHNNIAYLPAKLKPWRGSLLENLYFTLSSQGILGEENYIEVHSVIEQLSLDKYINKKWDELSTGYQMRFSLAKIILNKPKLIILDEPLANLDIGMQNIFLNDLKDIMKNQKVSIIISSHHIKEIENIADNLLILNKGESLYSGNIKEFEQNRKENLYEIIVNISANKLVNIFGDLIIKIEDRGSSLVLYTDISIDSKQILETLIKNNIQIKYFMDISQSAIKEIG